MNLLLHLSHLISFAAFNNSKWPFPLSNFTALLFHTFFYAYQGDAKNYVENCEYPSFINDWTLRKDESGTVHPRPFTWLERMNTFKFMVMLEIKKSSTCLLSMLCWLITVILTNVTPCLGSTTGVMLNFWILKIHSLLK